MKLVFAIKSWIPSGGAERVVSEVCSGLTSRGHEVWLFSFDAPSASPFYPPSEKVRLRPLGVGRTCRPSTIGELAQRTLRLRREIAAIRPNVAIGFMHSMYVPMSLALGGTGIPVIGSEHTVPEHFRSRPIQYVLVHLAAHLLTGMTIVSDSARALYPQRVQQRMKVVPNPVSTQQALSSTAGPRHRLMSVGRFDVEKDHHTLIKAFHQVHEQHSEWDLVIVGDGPLRTSIEELVSRLGLSHRVFLPGTTRNIHDQYQGASCFASASKYESFGLAIAEAMSHGLPVIGFQECRGAADLIENGKTGILVSDSTDRASSLAAALDRVLSNEKLRVDIGEAARASIHKMAGSDQVLDIWEQVLRSCAYHPTE